MGMPVRIENDLYISARDQAKAEHRTIAGQIEFWAKALQKINDSKEWQTFLEQNQWKPFFYGPKETRALLDQEYASIKSVLSKLGLAK